MFKLLGNLNGKVTIMLMNLSSVPLMHKKKAEVNFFCVDIMIFFVEWSNGSDVLKISISSMILCSSLSFFFNVHLYLWASTSMFIYLIHAGGCCFGAPWKHHFVCEFMLPWFLLFLHTHTRTHIFLSCCSITEFLLLGFN